MRFLKHWKKNGLSETKEPKIPREEVPRQIPTKFLQVWFLWFLWFPVLGLTKFSQFWFLWFLWFLDPGRHARNQRNQRNQNWENLLWLVLPPSSRGIFGSLVPVHEKGVNMNFGFQVFGGCWARIRGQIVVYWIPSFLLAKNTWWI